jgi:hypothetical protein
LRKGGHLRQILPLHGRNAYGLIIDKACNPQNKENTAAACANPVQLYRIELSRLAGAKKLVHVRTLRTELLSPAWRNIHTKRIMV